MAEIPAVIIVSTLAGWVGEMSLSDMVYSNGRKFIWIIIITWSIWGCAEAITRQHFSETDNRILTEADQGRTVELRVGESFQVVLRGNPTTGYTWGLQNFDGKTIRQTGEPVHIADSQMIGANGKTTFRFQAVNVGTVSLVLVYRRFFENKPEPEKQFEVQIHIR